MMKTFRNPVSIRSAADPFMTYDSDTGYYYALFTRGVHIELYRSRHAANIIADGDSKILYIPNGEKDGIWGAIWAPEMHRAPNGRWYVYTSGAAYNEAGAVTLMVLESLTEDPFGDWQFKNKPIPHVFSLDPTVYTAKNGQQFICYSVVADGRVCKFSELPDPSDEPWRHGLVIEIRPLENPWTVGEKKAMIGKAFYDWEKMPPYDPPRTINEGAFFVEKNGRLFVIYSGNGCWSDHYCLGVLEYVGGDTGDPDKMCDAANWIKHDKPLFTYANGVYGPGHASFFYSPDGTELWCAYHGMKEHNGTDTIVPRYMNIQKIDFDETGFPVMGKPVGYETDLVPPSGEIWE